MTPLPFVRTAALGAFFAVGIVLHPQLVAEEMLHRRADDRPVIIAAQVQKFGVQRYDSKRLILFTDIPEKQAHELVGLVDQVWPQWEAQLGPIPPARDGRPFQLTGYVMRDPQVFAEAGLVQRAPSNLLHGVHKNYEFWMDDQPWDYYRRHLLLHEATHCVMMCGEDTNYPPVWFLEGMAEFFGTHDPQPKFQSGVIPPSAEAAHGFGRIEMLRNEAIAGNALTARQVTRLGAREFSESRSTPYAWSWALCTYLARHPATRNEFRQLCRERNGTRFQVAFERLQVAHPEVLGAEWEIYRDHLVYGYDLERQAIQFTKSQPLSGSVACEVDAARGWQGVGVTVTAGQPLKITASGRITLATTTKPWISEPSGISIRYANQQPIGRLQGAIQRTTPAADRPAGHWEFFDLGPACSLAAPATGTLFLRINDRSDSLSDNQGSYQVTVSTAP
ncbi:MAG: hypothetical protein DWH91_12925 [Planctomycetota bacterium]|nr:MAG: hypothetical protein DWH91_12925 [Planctomycetota bacterium]